MNEIPDLSNALVSIQRYELGRGNEIVRIDRPAGSTCPLAVVFRRPLDIAGFLNLGPLPEGVRTWSNRDSHYPLEKGYVCERTRHALSGPLRD